MLVLTSSEAAGWKFQENLIELMDEGSAVREDGHDV